MVSGVRRCHGGTGALQLLDPRGSEQHLTTTLYSGPPDAVQFLPEAGLIATDRQTVSLRASTATANGASLRAFRRPFRVGGNTSYTLPPPLGSPQWTVAGTQVAVSWTQLPVIA